MLQALLNNKFPDINIWKEDLKTSTVLGNLIYLPSFTIYKILKRACAIKTPQNVGELCSYSFWSKYSADDESITNSRYVEPDVVFQFDQLDMIIEAKMSDYCGQYEEQWDKEVCSFCVEHGYSKPIILIALGGCTNLDPKDRTILFNNQSINYSVYKCTWHSLLFTLDQEYHETQDRTHARILENIIWGLNMFGVHNIIWLETLNKNNLSINQSSISIFNSSIWKK